MTSLSPSVTFPNLPVHPDRVRADEDPSRADDRGSPTIDHDDRRVSRSDDDDGATRANASRVLRASPLPEAPERRSRQIGTRSGVVGTQQRTARERQGWTEDPLLVQIGTRSGVSD